jgi:hypothetical protein
MVLPSIFGSKAFLTIFSSSSKHRNGDVKISVPLLFYPVGGVGLGVRVDSTCGAAVDVGSGVDSSVVSAVVGSAVGDETTVGEGATVVGLAVGVDPVESLRAFPARIPVSHASGPQTKRIASSARDSFCKFIITSLL